MIIAGILVLLGGGLLLVMDTLMTALGLADVFVMAAPVVDGFALLAAGGIALFTLLLL